LLTVGAASIERRESSGNETKGAFGIRGENLRFLRARAVRPRSDGDGLPRGRESEL